MMSVAAEQDADGRLNPSAVASRLWLPRWRATASASVGVRSSACSFLIWNAPATQITKPDICIGRSMQF
jgi:hypothetical protein